MIKPIPFILMLILTFFGSCSSTKNVSGIYYSNFAVNGFFSTKIVLNIDSTFSYRMRGDMMFDTSGGRYKMAGRNIVLHHEPFRPESSEYEKFGKEAVLLSYALSTNKHLGSPHLYFSRHDKLFLCDSSGRKIDKQFGYSKRKQYFLFGKHFYNRRYYLKRAS